MEIELTLKRWQKGFDFTNGSIYIDSKFICYTLEDQLREPGVKVPGNTCIGYGRYRITLEWSPKHKCIVPLLHDVPNFTEIEIHWGNTILDTEGCIIVGNELTTSGQMDHLEVLYNSCIKYGTSKPAFEKLMNILKGYNSIYINIV